MCEKPREYTENEVTERFLEHIWDYVRYWNGLDIDRSDKLEGLAFSILTAIDGGSLGLPSFILAPSPHPDDKEFHQQNGERWFPENHNVNITCDIAGGLHELFLKYRPKDMPTE